MQQGDLVVLSHVQAQILLAAHAAGETTVTTSLDLNRTTTQVRLDGEGVHFAPGDRLTWEDIAFINDDENSCFQISPESIDKIQTFSEATNRHYSLYPTAHAPTLLISGIPMHRIKASDPYRDTLAKVGTIQPIAGRVLDTATGLGYTATEAAKTADHVITVEFDPAVLEVARRNPWSQELFTHPHIEQRIGDSADVIQDFADSTFDCILHDPPMFALAGHLYSAEFYRELYRVLKPRGRLFHYIANPESKQGATITRGVLRRLEEVGFARVQRRAEAFGVVATKHDATARTHEAP
ncbi:MAG: methyltransferase domain-containing protein [Caldilineaceae bacterium]|nr:methyltransferase domain-containing protein [Caldilineaceae bacterium]